MALEPRVITVEGPVNPELVAMTRRLWVALALTVPLVALAMSDLIPGQPVQRSLSARVLAWLQLVLGDAGRPVGRLALLRAWRRVHRQPAVTLAKGDLRGIARARRLSRATMRNIRQNLFFALVYSALGVPVAAGVLYPVVGLLLSPIFAGAATTFSSVSVLANALRLRRLPL